MTEKKQRFKEIISTQKVIDTQTGKEYDCLLDNDFYDLVNEIAEENERLKEENQKLMKALGESGRMAVDTLLPTDEDSLTMNGRWW